MGEYADVKRKKMMQFLEWLAIQEGFSVSNGGNHQIVVKHSSWSRPFPVPFKRNRVNQYIVAALIKRILDTGMFIKEVLDGHL